MRAFPRQRYLDIARPITPYGNMDFLALLDQGPTAVASLHSHTGTKCVGQLLGPALFLVDQALVLLRPIIPRLAIGKTQDSMKRPRHWRWSCKPLWLEHCYLPVPGSFWKQCSVPTEYSVATTVPEIVKTRYVAPFPKTRSIIGPSPTGINSWILRQLGTYSYYQLWLLSVLPPRTMRVFSRGICWGLYIQAVQTVSVQNTRQTITMVRIRQARRNIEVKTM